MIKNMMLVMGLLSGFSFFSMQASDGSNVDAEPERLVAGLIGIVSKSLALESDQRFETVLKQISAKIGMIPVDFVVGFDNGRDPLSFRHWIDREITKTASVAHLEKAHGRLLQIKDLLPDPKPTKKRGASGQGEAGRGKLSNPSTGWSKFAWITGSLVAIALGWVVWKHSKNGKNTASEKKTGQVK